MPRNIFDIKLNQVDFNPQRKKKRVKLTPKQREYVWEHPKMYGRTCNICSHRITRLSDLELDHKHPYSQGGTKMNLVHRDCNRMKGSKSLKYIQKKLILKKSTEKKAIKKKSSKTKSSRRRYYINPLTGRKEYIRPLFSL